MALHSFAHSSAPLRRVKTIQFGILPPDEIKGLSVAKIEYPETYEEGSQRPKVGGLSDSRLGTIDRNFKCETCAESMQDCPGHFGHLEVRFLCLPVDFVAGYIGGHVNERSGLRCAIVEA